MDNPSGSYNVAMYETLTGQTPGLPFTASVYAETSRVPAALPGHLSRLWTDTEARSCALPSCLPAFPAGPNTPARAQCPSDGQLTFVLGANTSSASVPVLFDSPTLTITTNAVLTDANFQAPAQSSGGYQYISGAANSWTFDPYSGVQANGSAWGAPSAREGGTQTAFLQGSGASVSQSVTFPAGTYNISFYAAQRTISGGAQGIAVYYDSTLVGSWSAGTIPDSFTVLTTSNFAATAGTHTITIEGTSPGDNTAFIDDVW